MSASASNSTACARFSDLLAAHGKHLVAVLEGNQPELLDEADRLLPLTEPSAHLFKLSSEKDRTLEERRGGKERAGRIAALPSRCEGLPIGDFGMDDRTIELGPHLVSGVIDNSEEGRTTGHLVLNGIEAPVVLELAGNAEADLAGCVVKFHRPRSRPVEPDVAELLASPQRGTAGVIRAAARGGADRSGLPSVAPVLQMEWLNIRILTRFVLEADHCEFDIDLPRWTLSEDAAARQRGEFESALALFRQLQDEFEENALDDEINEEQFEKIDAILPELEAAESDEEKLALMRKALGPDASEYELQGLLEAYFEGDSDLPAESDAVGGDDGFARLIPVDDAVRSIAKPLEESVRTLAFRLESEEGPDGLGELVDGLRIATFQLLHGSPLDLLEGSLQIDPGCMVRQLEEERKRCESVIAYLELEGSADEKAAFRDQVWCLRGALEDLIQRIRAMMPEGPPPDDGTRSDVPF